MALDPRISAIRGGNFMALQLVTDTQATPGPTASTRRERYLTGKALRLRVPREAQAECPSADERDPIALLHASDAGRIPELLPMRYERMKESPLAFLRGAAALMAHDLAKLPPLGAPVQACGDCHLMNFGVFATSEERVLFDIDDFDETFPGVDFTVDLKRLVASVAVAANDAGLSKKKVNKIARETVTAYREFMRELAEMPPLEIWHARIDVARETKRIPDSKLRAKVRSILVKQKKDLVADDNFPHLAVTAGGTARIEDRPPRIYHLDEAESQTYGIDTAGVLASYRDTLLPERRMLLDRYALSDLAFKVVGIGSVGTFCAVGLYMTADDEPLFLQIKEARVSVMEKLCQPPEDLRQQGLRVVEGQRIMQAAADIFLGWTIDRNSNRHFYVRRLANRQLSSLGEMIEVGALEAYAKLCGRTLARAHARSADAATLAGYMGKSSAFDTALADFASAYAAVTNSDHARLLAAVDPGPGSATR
jgi:uncharacterized protein (DUF2252 family)